MNTEHIAEFDELQELRQFRRRVARLVGGFVTATLADTEARVEAHVQRSMSVEQRKYYNDLKALLGSIASNLDVDIHEDGAISEVYLAFNELKAEREQLRNFRNRLAEKLGANHSAPESVLLREVDTHVTNSLNYTDFNQKAVAEITFRARLTRTLGSDRDITMTQGEIETEVSDLVGRVTDNDLFATTLRIILARSGASLNDLTQTVDRLHGVAEQIEGAYQLADEDNGGSSAVSWDAIDTARSLANEALSDDVLSRLRLTARERNEMPLIDFVSREALLAEVGVANVYSDLKLNQLAEEKDLYHRVRMAMDDQTYAEEHCCPVCASPQIVSEDHGNMQCMMCLATWTEVVEPRIVGFELD